MNDNPFAEGESRTIRPPSTMMVIFGGTGDLAQRKLLPALYELARDEFLPREFIVVGVSRAKLSDEQYRELVRSSLEEHSRTEIDPEIWERFSRNVFFHPADATDPPSFDRFASRLEKLNRERGEAFNYLYYLATSPKHYGAIAQNLARVGLVADVDEDPRATRIVIEKPFGRDRDSAKELNRILLENFDERQIYRIDHYLGKETVQNILVFRFANGIFEPLWNHKYVDHIQISVCEDIGVSSRADYFDHTGILRDIVQNHLFQMLSLVCIEPPHSLSDADSIRDEKVKVLRSIKRVTGTEVFKSVVRAQYLPGNINGEPVPGYRHEKGVADNSETETYVAMRLEIDNWRWTGVPIYIRAGKRMPKRITEIAIVFRQPPRSLFRGRQIPNIEPNVLAIQVQPDEGISLKIGSKPPGMRMRVRPVIMDFHYDRSFGRHSPDAYERLLLDAMKGDPTLFTRNDEIEEAWDVIDPILDLWGSSRSSSLFEYKSGTWGPKAADDLLAPNRHQWRAL